MAIDYVELRLYDAAASTYVLLKNFQTVSFDSKYNDVGALQIAYPLEEAKTLGLKDQALVGVILGFSDGTISEPERYLIFNTSENKLSDGTRLRQCEGRSLISMLEDAVVYPSNWPVTAPTGHSFVAQTVGTMFRTLISRAKARGGLANMIETSFSGTTDSNGAAWTLTADRDFATNTGYLQILQDFMDTAYVDAKMVGWNLNIYNGGTLGNHVGIGTLEVRPARNVSDMEINTDSSESASTVLVQGEAGTAVERHSASAQTLIGRRRERGVSQGGIKDSGVLNILGDGELTLHGRINTEETVGLGLTGGPTPFKDFTVADWIWVRYDSDQAPVERRVRQLVLSVDQNGKLTCGITLNSIIMENDVRLQRKLEAYAGQGSNYGSQPNTGIDNTTPNAPSGLTINSTPYADSSGVYAAAVSASWTAPTTNVDGTTVTDLAGYEIQWRYVGDTNWSFVMPSDDNLHQWSPVAPGRQIQVQVRAYDTSGHRSSWTATITHTVAIDTTPPQQPTTPTVSAKIAAVEVKWDGLATTGGMDADVIRVEVWRSGTSGFAPQDVTSSLAGNLVKGGDTKLLYGPYGTVIYTKLVAVDRAGNRSVASAQASGTPLKIVATDITPGATPSDGNAPTAAPVVTVIGGIGALFVRWTAITNTDPVVYDVHMSASTGFTPVTGTLIGTVDGTSYTIRAFANGTVLGYGIPYYIKVIARDADGSGPASTQQSGTLVQVTTPDVAANYVYAGKIIVNQLTSGTISADAILSGTFRTATTGARVEVGPLGITTYASDNTPQTVLPSGAGQLNTFKGVIEAAGLTVTGGASFRSITNEITRGAAFTLQSNVTASQSSPSVVVDYETLALQDSFHGMGLVWKDSKWWTASWNDSGGTAYFESYDPVTGIRVDQIPMSGGSGAPFIPGGGLAWSGTFWYTVSLSLNDGLWWVCKWSPTGVFQLRSQYHELAVDGWYYEEFFVGTMSIGFRPSTGLLMVGEHDPATNKFQFESRDPANCSNVGTALSNSVGGFVAPVNGLNFGNFDYGSERVVISGRNSYNWVFTPGATYTYQGAESYPRPTGQITGAAWDGSNFFSARIFNDQGESDSHIFKHTNITWTTSSDGTWWAGFTWYDSNATGGTHETNISPYANLPMTKRARYTITAPGIPPGTGGTDDVNNVRFYLGRGTSSPAATAMYLQSTIASNTVTMNTATFSGTNPPTSNNFPTGGTPAKIVNSTGTLEISGDGSGLFSGLTVGTRAVPILPQTLFAACTAAVDLTTTEVDVTGCTLTFTTLLPNAKYLCIGSFYFSATGSAANTNASTGKLSVDGSVQSAFANFTSSSFPSTPDRTNSAQTWTGTLASAGSHTLKLRAVVPVVPSNSGVRVNATHTTITVLVFE